MMKIELQYYKDRPINSWEDRSDNESYIKYQRIFAIDYLSIDRDIEVSAKEFEDIISLGSIQLCGSIYDIISHQFKVDVSSNIWVLEIRNMGDINDESEWDVIDDDYLPF